MARAWNALTNTCTLIDISSSIKIQFPRCFHIWQMQMFLKVLKESKTFDDWQSWENIQLTFFSNSQISHSLNIYSFLSLILSPSHSFLFSFFLILILSHSHSFSYSFFLILILILILSHSLNVYSLSHTKSKSWFSWCKCQTLFSSSHMG
jgi:hypothetical protein